MHKILIPKIIESGKPEDMECLEKIMIDMIDHLKTIDHEMYKNVENKLYKIVYGEHLNKELATKWVAKMDNKDGTSGEHWSLEQTTQYAQKHNIYDWYAVLNMVYSDYYSPSFSTDTYVALANDWLNDPDVKDGKTLNYYLYVVCSKE